MKFTIRDLIPSDCRELCEIWKECDFRISTCMTKIWLNIGQNSTLVAQDINSEEILGACSGFKLWPDFTYIGFYCVKSQYQGLGIGSALWHKVMERIGTNTNMGLTANQPMIDKYKRIGFNIIGDSHKVFCRGRPEFSQLTTSVEGISVVSISEQNIKQVVEYDKRVSNGLDRKLVIEEYMKSEDSVTAVAIDDNQQVVGYCIITVSILDMLLLEPLYADNKQIAELLISKCGQRMPLISTHDLVVLCWNTNSDALTMATKIGLRVVREPPQLFTKQAIDVNVKQIFFLYSPYFYPY